MPLIDPGAQSGVFYNSTNILDYARMLANDVQGGISGQNLADGRPMTWPLLTYCYDLLALFLEDNNVQSAMYAEMNITLPATASYSDPSAQSRLGYDGFTDAAGFSYETPTLPPDLLEPLSIGQRLVTITEDGQIMSIGGMPFRPVRQKQGGLGNAWNYGWSGGTYGSIYGPWEFRQNSIYFLGGAYQMTQINLRYTPSQLQLVQPTPENPTPPVIWFAKAGTALANMIAAEYAEITGAKNALLLRTKANAQLEILANRSAKGMNRAQTRMRGYGFGRGRRRCL